ncbi:AraC family transcriptional regulator ligand-binding domain-containing protein [Nocardia sp. NPDC059228]|uniref:AraC family transcriptional regulator ligand-binding domain-containing protein n=1 Tax=Nocardia sp. NPDC059228 TaxID=3346777 RepID=UPI0036CC2C42
MATTVLDPSGNAVDTVSSHVVGVIADAARRAGAETEQIAQLLGRDPALLFDDTMRIPTATASRLWELLHRLAGPEAGVLAADVAELGRLHVWDYLIGNAPTLAEGLRDAARYNNTICDRRVDLEVVEDGSLLTARYLDLPHRGAAGAANKEFVMAVMVRRATESFGDAGRPVRVDFSHRGPDHRAHLIRALGTGNIHFGQDRDAITFLATAETRGRTNDPVLQRILRSHAQQLIDSIGPEPAWLDVFRAALHAALPESGGDGAGLAEVATALRISDRTLQRRLAEHGTSWRAELDIVRRDTAIALLRDRTVPVGSVALRLGYRDHRVLARAFRRWTGQSPASFRRDQPR